MSSDDRVSSWRKKYSETTALLSDREKNWALRPGTLPASYGFLSAPARKPWYHWKNLLAAVIVILVVSGVALGMMFLWRLITAPTYIGSPVSESQALTRANERIIQMVQWMISTILLLGGGLIGLNWYQSNQRYERDKEDLERRLEEVRRFEERAENYARELRNAPSEIQKSLESQFSKYFEETPTQTRLPLTDADDEPPSPSSPSDERQKGTFRAFLDNIYSRETLPPIQRQVERYINPNPFEDIRIQKLDAVSKIEEMLATAYNVGTPKEDLEKDGIEQVYRILPALTAEDAESADRLFKLLIDLGFDKRG